MVTMVAILYFQMTSIQKQPSLGDALTGLAPVKFQIDHHERLRVRVKKGNFTMAAILIFQMAPISKAT